MNDWIEAISNQVKEQKVVCKECNCALVDQIPRKTLLGKRQHAFVPNASPISAEKKAAKLVIGCMICMEQFCGNCMSLCYYGGLYSVIIVDSWVGVIARAM